VPAHPSGRSNRYVDSSSYTVNLRVREKPGANSGKTDERRIAGFAGRFLQRERDRAVELSHQAARKRAGRMVAANRSKMSEERIDRRSCAA
jgi:hypothetical protein